MAKATIKAETVIVPTPVVQDVYHLELTRDEAIAIYSLCGKVDNKLASPRSKELNLAAGRIYSALDSTGKLTLRDSMCVQANGVDATTLIITDQSVYPYSPVSFWNNHPC